ncbi:MAG: class I SAM-dependent methyltransferase [Steroidobacteraceae bacterium]|jgi:SAM-dependent methyltransferase|nr:class I SAM-dependent methyltransferase [Steroidobacteraceae bacterium]
MSPAAAAQLAPVTSRDAPLPPPAHAAAPLAAVPSAQLPIGTLPQPWRTIGRHAVLLRLTPDEQARLDALTHLNHFLAQEVVPAMRGRFERDAAVATPEDRDQAFDLLERDPRYGIWSELRRNSMEVRQQRNLEAALRQRDELAAACRDALASAEAAATLELDPTFTAPDYLVKTHAHLLPGGYLTDGGADDVAVGAAYEASSYAVVPGRSGPHSDGAGRALARWLVARFPDFRPRRILDLGCGAGLNTCAVARAFPDAEVIAIDAGAGLLRYAAARAASLGIRNVRWVQADIEQVPERFGGADLAYTAIVLHETSHRALRNVFRSCHERLAPGGLTLHVEQPPYHDRPWFEQCMRDWDGRYNNEAFWSRIYELDLGDELAQAGFERPRIFEDRVSAVPWNTDPRAPGKSEDYGRTGNWQVVGAWRAPA